MRVCLLLLLRNVRKHNSMKFQAAGLRVSSDKFWNCLKDLKYNSCILLFVGEKQTPRPTNWKSDTCLTLNHLRIQNFPREIPEMDTSFMVYEIQVTCRKLVNLYAFNFFQTHYLHEIVCFLNSWKEHVKIIVQRGASLIEVLFWINSWLVIFASSEILSK